MRRKICIVTGTRAEYGILTSLLKELKSNPNFQLQIIVTGMHLSPAFGMTYQEIERDGYKIDEQVEMLVDSDTEVGITKSIGLGIIGFSDSFKKLVPDLVILLGDRFETLAAAIAAFTARIPIAHIGGGDITEGAMDDAFRHVITKLSFLHFVINEEHRKRVIQLGEDPKRVFAVGAMGIDNIKNMKYLSKQQLAKELKIKWHKYNFLVTFHPATLGKTKSHEQFQNLLEALDELQNTGIIFTNANADEGGRIINKMIDKYVAAHPDKTIAFVSLGMIRYLSLMRYVDALVGNSSSGIVEAPSFKIGVINIGDRQKGRMKAGNVIDCEPDRLSIQKAFHLLHSRGFQQKLKYIKNLYGDGNAARRITDIIKKFDFTKGIQKKFYNINF